MKFLQWAVIALFFTVNLYGNSSKIYIGHGTPTNPKVDIFDLYSNTIIDTNVVLDDTVPRSYYRSLLYSKDGKTVYISREDGKIVVIDIESGATLRTLSGSSYSQSRAMAMDDNETKLYVTNSTQGISVFNLTTNTHSSDISICSGNGIGGIVNAGGFIYTGCKTLGTIVKIDPSDDSNTTLVTGLTNPTAIATNKAQDTLYVADLGASPNGMIHIVNIADQNFTTHTGFGQPQSIEINPNESKLYAADTTNEVIHIFDLTSKTITNSITNFYGNSIGIVGDNLYALDVGKVEIYSLITETKTSEISLSANTTLAAPFMPSVSQQMYSQMPSGSGTEGDPYLIASLANLKWLSEEGNATTLGAGVYYKQTANIDAYVTRSWNGGAGFLPIAPLGTTFKANYDGQDYNITNLFMKTTTLNAGFIRASSQNTLKNINIIDANISTTYNSPAGILAGSAYGTIIEKCHTSGTIKSTGNKVGGLVGSLDQDGNTAKYSDINQSSSSVNVQANYYAGGLVGELLVSTINQSFANGNVSASSGAGGLVGAITDANGRINNSYSKANVSGSSSGGIVGSSYTGTISNTYAAGTSSDEGFAGTSGVTITHSFWDVTTSGIGSSGTSNEGAIGKTTAQMTTATTYLDAGWDFEVETTNGTDNIWDIDLTNQTVNDGYPFLSWENGSYTEYDLPPTYTFSPDDGDGFVSLDTNITITFNEFVRNIDDTNLTDANVTSFITLKEDSSTGNDINFTATIDATKTIITINPDNNLTINKKIYVAISANIEDDRNNSITESNITFNTYNAPDGNGSSGNPYQISNIYHLAWVAENNISWSQDFVQTGHIDASDTSTWNDGEGFVPIGNSSVKFTGNYDGKGYSISNLYINRTSDKHQGLFGYVDQGTTIKNLTLTNTNINVTATTTQAIGMLVGYGGNAIGNGSASNVILENITINSGSITVNGSGIVQIGSVIGGLYDGNISNVESNATITYTGTAFSNSIGGIVGYGEFLNIIDSQSKVTLTSSSGNNSYIGGFIAQLQGNGNVNESFSSGILKNTNGGTIGGFVGTMNTRESLYSIIFTDSYSTADINVTSSFKVGGFFGSAYPNSNQKIIFNKTYAASTINGISTNDKAGGFGGYISKDIKFEGSSFWDGDETSLTTAFGTESTGYVAGIITEKTSTEMKTVATFATAGWDINTTANYTDEIWVMDESNISNDGYPTFASQVVPTAVQPSGTGTSGDPYQIENINHLVWVSENNISWDKDFNQTADINAYFTRNMNDGAGFTPIGTDSFTSFEGHYNGQDFNILNLHINRTAPYIGLFGHIKTNASISNINILDANITGSTTNIDLNGLGILAGFVDGNGQVTLNNIKTTGNITLNGVDTSYASVGGVVGVVNSDVITTNVESNVSIISNDTTLENTLGGLIGTMVNSEADNWAPSNTGGTYRLKNTGAYGLITTLSTKEHIGGLIGTIKGGTSSNIKRIILSYASTNITATNNSATGSIGGLIGSFHASSTWFYNVYAKSNITVGSGTNVGGFFGWTELTPTSANQSFYNCYSASTITGGSDGAFGGNRAADSDTISIWDSFWDTGATQNSNVFTVTAPNVNINNSSGQVTSVMKDKVTYLNLVPHGYKWDFQGEPTSGSNDFWGWNATINDAYPYLAWQVPNQAPVDINISSNTIYENNATGTFIGTATATDPDVEDNVTLSICNNDGNFSMDSDGNITNAVVFNYEATHTKSLCIRATDDKGLYSEKTFTIQVINVNENLVINTSNSITSNENNLSALTISATDDDNDTLTYSITGTDAGLFNIDTTTGAITFKNNPDYETNAGPFSITLSVTDGNLTITKAINITVANINDAPVITTDSNTTVNENNITVVITARDDDNDTITFGLLGDDNTSFDINTSTGVLTFKSNPDYENPDDNNTDGTYEITISISDGNFTVYKDINITLANINDAPEITSSSSPQGEENNISVITVTATDDDNDTLSFRVGGTDASYMDINSSTGVLTFKNPPQYDVKDTYSLIVFASDSLLEVNQSMLISMNPYTDTDGDGIYDRYEGNITLDTDNDGIPNYLDTDSDGDGIPDLNESRDDNDSDGIPNFLDTDSDGDGKEDNATSEGTEDEDRDGIPNYLDPINDTLVELIFAINAISIDNFLGTNLSTDEIVSDLNFTAPLNIASGIDINWTSEAKFDVGNTNRLYLDINETSGIGTVNRGTEDIVVRLNVKVSKNGFSSQKSFVLTIIKDNLTASEKLARNLVSLDWFRIKGNNEYQSQIISNLNLPTTGTDDVNISWSSDKSYIDENGTVTRDLIDENVKLIATLVTLDDDNVTILDVNKTFNLIVKKDITDCTTKLNNAKLDLTVEKLLGSNRSANEIVEAIILDTNASRYNLDYASDLTLSFFSDNSAIKVDSTNRGQVVRNALEDKKVKILTEITCNTSSVYKSFDFVVKKSDALVELVIVNDVNDTISVNNEMKIYYDVDNGDNYDYNDSHGTNTFIAESNTTKVVSTGLTRESNLDLSSLTQVIQNVLTKLYTNGIIENISDVQDSVNNVITQNIIKSEVLGATIKRESDGSVEINATINGNIAVVSSDENDVSHILKIGATETKATSLIKGTKTVITADRKLQTATPVRNVYTSGINKDYEIVVETNSTGTSTNKFIITDNDDNGSVAQVNVVTNDAEAQSDINANGELTVTSKAIGGKQAIIFTDSEGNTGYKIVNSGSSEVVSTKPFVSNSATDVNITVSDESGVLKVITVTPILQRTAF